MSRHAKSQSRTISARPRFPECRGQSLILKTITTLILAAGAGVIMIPFLYLLSTSVKDRDQMRQSPPPLIPMAATTVEINGQDEPLYPGQL